MYDSIRENYEETHPVGTVISYEHSGKTNIGKPRFARYLRKRDDIIVKDEIQNPSIEKKNNLKKLNVNNSWENINKIIKKYLNEN